MNWKTHYDNSHSVEGDDNGSGGDAASAAAAGANANADGSQNSGAQGGKQSDPANKDAASLLESGGKDPAGQAWAAPEKYQVKKEDGSIDIEATAQKIDAARSELEKRLGAGGLPPETPDAYVIETLPDGMTMDDLKADPLFGDFAAKAHKAGYNNEQIALAVNEFYARAEEMGGGMAKLDDKAAAAELQRVWTTKEDFQTNLKLSHRAASAVAEKAGIPLDQVYKDIGNNPTFMRLMAAIGPEFAEDTRIDGEMTDTQNWEQQVAELKADPAYLDGKNPKHKEVMDKVNALYAKRYPEKKT